MKKGVAASMALCCDEATIYAKYSAEQTQKDFQERPRTAKYHGESALYRQTVSHNVKHKEVVLSLGSRFKR